MRTSGRTTGLPFFGPLGYTRARNAPPGKAVPPAMSRWLRCIIGKPDTSIVGVDWSSQEFALAAILSGDEEMVEAYRSGDPLPILCPACRGYPHHQRGGGGVDQESFQGTEGTAGEVSRVRRHTEALQSDRPRAPVRDGSGTT